MTEDIRRLRERLRKIYSELTNELFEVISKIDKTLEALEDKDA